MREEGRRWEGRKEGRRARRERECGGGRVGRKRGQVRRVNKN